MFFEWDTKKNYINYRKHGITFEEAVSVFYDDNAIVFDDPIHSLEEERYLILGYNYDMKMLIVSHCYKKDELHLRIISARKATKSEEMFYYRNNA